MSVGLGGDLFGEPRYQRHERFAFMGERAPAVCAYGHAGSVFARVEPALRKSITFDIDTLSPRTPRCEPIWAGMIFKRRRSSTNKRSRRFVARIGRARFISSKNTVTVSLSSFEPLERTLHHPIPDCRNRQDTDLALILSYFPLGGGSGTYLRRTSSCAICSRKASTPCVSMAAKVTPSMPGAPSFSLAHLQQCDLLSN
jgi:hypothetical protein